MEVGEDQVAEGAVDEGFEVAFFWACGRISV